MKYLLIGGLLVLFVVGFGLGIVLNKDRTSIIPQEGFLSSKI